jgi:hypothetical protein
MGIFRHVPIRRNRICPFTTRLVSPMCSEDFTLYASSLPTRSLHNLGGVCQSVYWSFGHVALEAQSRSKPLSW